MTSRYTNSAINTHLVRRMSVVSVVVAGLAMAQGYVFAGYGIGNTVSYAKDKEYVQSVEWMNNHEMTQYKDAGMFRPGDYVTREQAAKFFVGYVNAFMSGGTEQHIACEFKDINNADVTLQMSIEAACRLGLFYGAEGYFLPQQAMTKAQAITVLIRALEQKYEETGTPRWSVYFERARVLGITKETNVRRFDAPLTRYEMALLLARSQGMVAPEGSIDISDGPITDSPTAPYKNDMDDLKDLLLEMGLRTE